jgi:predicted dienelactone hydrolase
VFPTHPGQRLAAAFVRAAFVLPDTGRGLAARVRSAAALLLLGLAAGTAGAATGLATIAATPSDGSITVFYPSSGQPQPLKRGPFTVDVVADGPAVRGNGRLVVISHGSGGAPWVHTDLARALVDAGFVVAFPEHRDDNHRNGGRPGPDSWKRRPGEVSSAIDALGRDPRFAARLALNRVGIYGMSAGGHTALSLAGGHWSPARLTRHCEANIAEDFHSCAGMTTRLDGGPLDPMKQLLAITVARQLFFDDTPQRHHDPRIAAAVAAVPFAADFDPASLVSPPIPLGLVTAGRDRFLVPRFHSGRVLHACRRCEHLADLPTAGHGSLLSPPPPGMTGIAAELLGDPPGFDRRLVRLADAKVVDFFLRHLPAAAP